MNMTKASRAIISKVFFATLLVLLITNSIYPLVMGNFSENAYDGSTDDNTEKLTISLSNYIVNGAGYYLKAYSETLMFLNRVEMSEVAAQDFNEMLDIVNRAIDNIKIAGEYYRSINARLAYLPYDFNIFYRLLYFDYAGFQREKGLNASIFQKVRYYLGYGDVNGIFSTLQTDTENILSRLYTIKSMVEAGQYPDLENLWRINQQFSETMLFGQYTSEIFICLK
jgi:hypothetical protein